MGRLFRGVSLVHNPCLPFGLFLLCWLALGPTLALSEEPEIQLKEPPWDRRNRADQTAKSVDNRFDEDPVLMFNPTIFLGGGFGIYFQQGDNFHFPALNVEVSVGRQLTLGTLINFRYTSSAGVWALASNGLLTANFYPLGKFNHLIVRFAGGLALAHVSRPKTTETDPTFAGALGWRYLIKDSYTPLSLGLLLGYQRYFRNTGSDGALLLQFEIGVLE